MANDIETLRRALRRMPVPAPRAGFIDNALAQATAGAARRLAPPQPGRLGHFLTRWETWLGAALGSAVAATLTFMLLEPGAPSGARTPQISLVLHESRAIDVLIDSQRELKDATIRIVASGSVTLEGFEDERRIGWRADLERGSNLLSLPVVARTPGKGRLVAIIEHDGRAREVAIDLTVLNTAVSRS